MGYRNIARGQWTESNSHVVPTGSTNVASALCWISLSDHLVALALFTSPFEKEAAPLCHNSYHRATSSFVFEYINKSATLFAFPWYHYKQYYKHQQNGEPQNRGLRLCPQQLRRQRRDHRSISSLDDRAVRYLFPAYASLHICTKA